MKDICSDFAGGSFCLVRIFEMRNNRYLKSYNQHKQLFHLLPNLKQEIELNLLVTAMHHDLDAETIAT